MRLNPSQPAEQPGRPRDEVWDAMVEIFGDVPPRTNAHGKRNKAVGDLKKLGATRETIRSAVLAWPRHFEGATLTDTALATHYPQLYKSNVSDLTDEEKAAVERAKQIDQERENIELVPMPPEAREALKNLGILKDLE